MINWKTDPALLRCERERLQRIAGGKHEMAWVDAMFRAAQFRHEAKVTIDDYEVCGKCGQNVCECRHD